jgi:hypothetical protein
MNTGPIAANTIEPTQAAGSTSATGPVASYAAQNFFELLAAIIDSLFAGPSVLTADGDAGLTAALPPALPTTLPTSGFDSIFGDSPAIGLRGESFNGAAAGGGDPARLEELESSGLFERSAANVGQLPSQLLLSLVDPRFVDADASGEVAPEAESVARVAVGSSTLLAAFGTSNAAATSARLPDSQLVPLVATGDQTPPEQSNGIPAERLRTQFLLGSTRSVDATVTPGVSLEPIGALLGPDSPPDASARVVSLRGPLAAITDFDANVSAANAAVDRPTSVSNSAAERLGPLSTAPPPTNGFSDAITTANSAVPARLPLGLLPTEARIVPTRVILRELEQFTGASFRTDALEPPVTPLAAEARHGGASAGEVSATVLARIDRVEFVERITQALERAHSQSPNRLEFELHPPELGRLRIQVVGEHGELTARIEVHSPTVRNLILEHLPVLDRHLAEHGIQFHRIHVDGPPGGSFTPQGQQEANYQHQQQTGGREQECRDAYGWSRQPDFDDEGTRPRPLSIDDLLALAPGMDVIV